jgi:hypothetical protein
MKFLLTAAIIPNYFDQRKLEYLESFKSLLKYVDKENIFIVETFLNSTTSYLNELTDQVIYTGPTTNHLRNQGVKEAIGLIKSLKSLKIDNNDIIVKHTGRYKFLSDLFIEDIKQNDHYDAFIREGTDSQYFFGTFGIRYGLFKRFLLEMDLNNMESNMISIERELYNFIHARGIKTKLYSKIDVYSNIANHDVFVW